MERSDGFWICSGVKADRTCWWLRCQGRKRQELKMRFVAWAADKAFYQEGEDWGRNGFLELGGAGAESLPLRFEVPIRLQVRMLSKHLNIKSLELHGEVRTRDIWESPTCKFMVFYLLCINNLQTFSSIFHTLTFTGLVGIVIPAIQSRKLRVRDVNNLPAVA